MAWTEDRVELLKKLWADGLSASQIAKRLGGVTRNAVIGKVHRLGLSGRASPSRPTRRPVAAPKPAARAKPQTQAASPAARNAASKPVVRTQSAPRPPAPVPPAEAKRLASGDFATVLTLKDSMCKWPLGDPADQTFRFCGHKTEPGQTYCEAHKAVAYQPASKRRRKPADDARAVLDSLASARRVNF